MTLRCLIAVSVFITVTSADRVPTAEDVEDYNDPVLREVFASSRMGPMPNRFPQHLPTTGTSPAVKHTRIRQQPQVAVPAAQTAPYQATRTTYPTYQMPMTMTAPPAQAGYYTSSPFAQLAVQGGQAFLNGAQAVGQAFGIQPGYASGYSSAYEMPITGGFFG